MKPKDKQIQPTNTECEPAPRRPPAFLRTRLGNMARYDVNKHANNYDAFPTTISETPKRSTKNTKTIHTLHIFHAQSVNTESRLTGVKTTRTNQSPTVPGTKISDTDLQVRLHHTNVSLCSAKMSPVLSELPPRAWWSPPTKRPSPPACVSNSPAQYRRVPPPP